MLTSIKYKLKRENEGLELFQTITVKGYPAFYVSLAILTGYVQSDLWHKGIGETCNTIYYE